MATTRSNDNLFVFFSKNIETLKIKRKKKVKKKKLKKKEKKKKYLPKEVISCLEIFSCML